MGLRCYLYDMSRHEAVRQAVSVARKARREISPTSTPQEKADQLETLMLEGHTVQVMPPWPGDVTRPAPEGLPTGRFLMGDDPRLPAMPERPSLYDFYAHRVALNETGMQHMLQSAALAQDKGLSDNVVLACLLHDISVTNLIRTDHGYWAAQLIEPYVDAEVTEAVRYHQALRYFAAPDYDYDYPAFYREVFGEDYEPADYLVAARDFARSQPWYDMAMQVVVNDFYAFDENVRVDLSRFEDIMQTAFRNPAEGLGFDASPSAHMWRTLIWPNNVL